MGISCRLVNSLNGRRKFMKFLLVAAIAVVLTPLGGSTKSDEGLYIEHWNSNIVPMNHVTTVSVTPERMVFNL